MNYLNNMNRRELKKKRLEGEQRKIEELKKERRLKSLDKLSYMI